MKLLSFAVFAFIQLVHGLSTDEIYVFTVSSSMNYGRYFTSFDEVHSTGDRFQKEADVSPLQATQWLPYISNRHIPLITTVPVLKYKILKVMGSRKNAPLNCRQLGLFPQRVCDKNTYEDEVETAATCDGELHSIKYHGTLVDWTYQCYTYSAFERLTTYTAAERGSTIALLFREGLLSREAYRTVRNYERAPVATLVQDPEEEQLAQQVEVIQVLPPNDDIVEPEEVLDLGITFDRDNAFADWTDLHPPSVGSSQWWLPDYDFESGGDFRER